MSKNDRYVLDIIIFMPPGLYRLFLAALKGQGKGEVNHLVTK